MTRLRGGEDVARQLDQIVVIDVEDTCWESTPPAGQELEIIEIGVCTLSVATRQRLDHQSILVRPQRSTVSAYCTSLTTLTQQQVSTGLSFKEACACLRKEFATQDRVWASWGDYDRRQFERQCQVEGIPYPFGPSHPNVKSLFALMHALPHEVGMDEALRTLHLPLEGTHHRAGDDARNIALILATLLGSGVGA
jgi:inhibitor of KinA sporulation pathway (predicted exonuclease)